jgi:predicted RNA binding protein YcfA (HicA-like mRNA interferase family)
VPRWGPIKRKDLIAYLHRLGFDGPYPGRRHAFMKKGALTVRVPNTDIDDRDLLSQILKQAGIDRDTWTKL